MPIRASAPEDATADQEACCICLETIPTNARVELPCGHNTFCGQCLVTHLLREVRCPVCRQGGEDSDDQSIISDEEEPRFFNSRAESMKLARKDKRNKHSFELIQAYRKKAAEANKAIKELQLKTRDAEKILQSKLALYEAQLDANFTKKYGAIESKIKDFKKARSMAKGRAQAIETRLFKKYANTSPNAGA